MVVVPRTSVRDRRRMTVAGSRRLGGVAVLAAAAVTVSVLMIGETVAPAAAGVRVSAARVHWGEAREVPGIAALNAGGDATVIAVSCWRPGDCAAGGFFTDASGHQQAFVVDEAGGVWGRAQEVPGTAALNAGGGARVSTVSCAPGGGCAAGGYYTNSNGKEHGFVVSQSRGRWGRAEAVVPVNLAGSGQVQSISCPSAGNCGAGGLAFVVSERDGRWAKAETVPGILALSPPDVGTHLVTVSCASAGNCTAGGFFWGSVCAGGFFCLYGFAVSLVNGRWDRVVQPSGGGPVYSVSCWHPGDCTAAGANQADDSTTVYGFAETQTRGRWGKARTFSPQLDLDIRSVSCSSAGNCAAGGDQGTCACDAGFTNGTFVFSEHDGRWGKVDILAGLAALGTVKSVSCSSAGNCGTGGSGFAGNALSGAELTQAFVLGERDGKWAVPETPPGLAALNLGANSQVNHVSCPSADSCAAGGYYTDAAGRTQAWVDG
jgi:hypothetical protein